MLTIFIHVIAATICSNVTCLCPCFRHVQAVERWKVSPNYPWRIFNSVLQSVLVLLVAEPKSDESAENRVDDGSAEHTHRGTHFNSAVMVVMVVEMQNSFEHRPVICLPDGLITLPEGIGSNICKTLICLKGD